MLHDILKTSEFTRTGSLKSLVEFSFCGEVSSITVREKKKFREGEETAKSQEFYLIIEDSYGFQCSYFRQGLTMEKARDIAARIPYGRSIFISGEVAIRKGNTFFNAKTFKNPDDTDILLIRSRDECEEGVDGKVDQGSFQL